MLGSVRAPPSFTIQLTHLGFGQVALRAWADSVGDIDEVHFMLFGGDLPVMRDAYRQAADNCVNEGVATLVKADDIPNPTAVARTRYGHGRSDTVTTNMQEAQPRGYASSDGLPFSATRPPGYDVEANHEALDMVGNADPQSAGNDALGILGRPFWGKAKRT
jgi:hypothetical protein